MILIDQLHREASDSLQEGDDVEMEEEDLSHSSSNPSLMKADHLMTAAISYGQELQTEWRSIATIVIFPIVNRKIGSLWTYRSVVLSYPLLYFLVPYLSLLPDKVRLPCVYVALVWKVTAQAFAYPSSVIMLANNAPSSKVLGTLNGAAASAASACRAFGPTFSGILQSAGLSMGTLGLPWWVNVLVAMIGAAISMFMVEERRRTFESEKDVPEPLLQASDIANATDGSGMAVAEDASASHAPSSPLLTRMSLDIRRSHIRHDSKP